MTEGVLVSLPHLKSPLRRGSLLSHLHSRHFSYTLLSTQLSPTPSTLIRRCVNHLLYVAIH
jgi:hypothetical protein